MLAILKRYSMAFVFLAIVVVLMLAGTMGVMSFADKMLKDTGVETQVMKPRGEDVTK
jgi:hypothetical protein